LDLILGRYLDWTWKSCCVSKKPNSQKSKSFSITQSPSSSTSNRMLL